MTHVPPPPYGDDDPGGEPGGMPHAGGDALDLLMAEAFAASRDVTAPPAVLAAARARIAAEASAHPASERRGLAPAPIRPAARPPRREASQTRRALWPAAFAALALGLVLAWALLQPSPETSPVLVAESVPSAETLPQASPEAPTQAEPSPVLSDPPEARTEASPRPAPEASAPPRPAPRPLRATPQATSPEASPPPNIAQASPETVPEVMSAPEAERVRDEVLLAFRLFSETRERAETLVAGEIAAATQSAGRALTP